MAYVWNIAIKITITFSMLIGTIGFFAGITYLFLKSDPTGAAWIMTVSGGLILGRLAFDKYSIPPCPPEEK